MDKINYIQLQILKILYEKEINDERSSFEEILESLKGHIPDINENTLRRALYDGKSKDFFRWQPYHGEEFPELKIGSIGIVTHEELLEDPFFDQVSSEILKFLDAEWKKDPAKYGFAFKELQKEINSNRTEDKQIKTELFVRIGLYLEDLGLIDNDYYYWKITSLGRDSLKEIKYLIPENVQKITINTIINLKKRSIREGSFLDFNKRIFIEFKSIAKEARGKKFARVISAFANTKGGHIIVGVLEEDSTIKSLNGVLPSEVEDILKAFHHIKPFIEPTKNDLFQEITLENGNVILVFFIPRMPRCHGVINGEIKYYVRIGPECRPLNKEGIIRLKKEKIRFRRWSGLIPL